MVDFNQVVKHLFKASCHDHLPDYQRSRLFFEEMRRASVRTEQNLEPLVYIEQKEIHIHGKMQTDTRIVSKKEEALRKTDHLANEKKELYEKEKAFQQNFKNFNTLIIQNREKRERVLARTRELKAIVVRRQEDIEKISIEIRKMREYKLLFNKEIDKYLFYEDFLEKTLYEFGKKVSCLDVIHRYINLDSKREYVTKIDMNINEMFKDLHVKAVNFMKQRHETILKMRKQLTDNITEYEKAKSRTPEMEILVFNIWEDCIARLKCLIECVRSIQNLNEQIRRRKAERHLTLRTTREMKKLGNVPSVMKHVVHVNTTLKALERVTRAVQLSLKALKILTERYPTIRITNWYEEMTGKYE